MSSVSSQNHVSYLVVAQLLFSVLEPFKSLQAEGTQIFFAFLIKNVNILHSRIAKEQLDHLHKDWVPVSLSLTRLFILHLSRVFNGKWKFIFRPHGSVGHYITKTESLLFFLVAIPRYGWNKWNYGSNSTLQKKGMSTAVLLHQVRGKKVLSFTLL